MSPLNRPIKGLIPNVLVKHVAGFGGGTFWRYLGLGKLVRVGPQDEVSVL